MKSQRKPGMIKASSNDFQNQNGDPYPNATYNALQKRRVKMVSDMQINPAKMNEEMQRAVKALRTRTDLNPKTER